MPMVARLLQIVAACMMLAGAPANAQNPTEYDVKAAFLLNFTKFVEWPESVFESPSAPFRICIVGEDPFGETLDKMVEGEKVASHKLVVDRLKRGSSAGGCEVAFYTKADRNAAQSIAREAPHVLTVGETDEFLHEGGVIRFVLDHNRVRFDVSQAAARKAELKVSSKLLNVARRVEDEP